MCRTPSASGHEDPECVRLREDDQVLRRECAETRVDVRVPLVPRRDVGELVVTRLRKGLVL